MSVRKLGGTRAGAMRIGRFLHNDKVTVTKMLSHSLRAQLCRRGGTACSGHTGYDGDQG